MDFSLLSEKNKEKQKELKSMETVKRLKNAFKMNFLSPPSSENSRSKEKQAFRELSRLCIACCYYSQHNFHKKCHTEESIKKDFQKGREMKFCHHTLQFIKILKSKTNNKAKR
jgi:hypothetical protein